ncbi:molecular chaperone TorD family protein [Saccharothrix luteola]|uniref:molecular chaperone TorD family protein n=1 Tax=Saccharothrix luteola TaxID=2893018 RepID=UPI00355828A7
MVSERFSPYPTYFAYGDIRKRGMALLRFKHAYPATGLEPDDGELPDQLAIVLEFTAAWPRPARRRRKGERRRGRAGEVVVGRNGPTGWQQARGRGAGESAMRRRPPLADIRTSTPHPPYLRPRRTPGSPHRPMPIRSVRTAVTDPPVDG